MCLFAHPGARARQWLATLLIATSLAGCGGEKPEDLVRSAQDFLAKNEPQSAIIQLKNALQEDVTLAEARYLLGLALLRAGDAAGSETELRRALTYDYPPEKVFPTLAEAMLAQKQYRKLASEFDRQRLKEPQAQARLASTLAEAYTAMGKTDEARAAFLSALSEQPNHVPALLGMARNMAAQRNFDGARAEVDKALASNPESHEAWRLKGDVLWFGSREPVEAMAAYQKSIALKPDYVDGLASILDAHVSQGKLDEAGKTLESLRAVAARTQSVLYYETLLAHLNKDAKSARTLSQQLLQQAPGDLRSLQLAGEIALVANALIPAQEYLSEALRLSPQSDRARRMLVRAYLRAGKPSRALATLQPVLQSGKADATIHGLAGEVYLQDGDLPRAQAYFDKAARQDPANSRTRTSLALVRMASGNVQAAVSELRDIAAADRTTATDLVLITALFDRKEFDRALSAIDALEKKQPDNPLAANLRGNVLLAKGDAAGARKSFERALEIQPSFFPPVARLASMDVAQGKPEAAFQRFEAVATADPGNHQAFMAMASLRQRGGGTSVEVAALLGRAVAANPGNRLARMALVEHHLQSRDFKSASSAAQNAVAALPDEPELLDLLGRVQQASGDANQALVSFGKLATLMPESPLPHMRLANVHGAMNNLPAAEASLRKALGIQADFLDAQRGLLMLAVNARNYSEALAIARTVQKQRPRDAAGYLFEGDTSAVQQKWGLAEDAYRLGLKQNPASTILATKVHSAMASGGNGSGAASFAAKWVADKPKDAGFRLYLGNQASAREDYPTAEKWYSEVTRLEPGNASAFNNLAWVSGKLGKDAVALQHAEKAIALDPGQSAFMDTLAMLHSERNDYAKALEWQNKAIGLQPDSGLYRFNLAKIHLKAGQKALARQELDQVAKMGDKFGGQAEVARLLQSL